MTLPPEKIGDKGQRYLIRVKDYPKKGWQDVGWCNDRVKAYDLGEALSMAPSADGYEVVDRDPPPGPQTAPYNPNRPREVA